MKVILLQDVGHLGAEGDIVTVKAGYGQNYLIPQGLARIATKGTIKARHEEMRQQVRKRARQQQGAERLKQELEKIEVVVEAKVGEQNRIFGTVTPQQVAVKLALQGFTIDRRDIRLREDVRLIGVYTASVKVHTGVEAELKVRVVPDQDSAAVPVAATESGAEAEPTAAAAEAGAEDTETAAAAAEAGAEDTETAAVVAEAGAEDTETAAVAAEAGAEDTEAVGDEE